MTVIHINREPMRELSRRADGDRWCFRCRKRVAFERVVTAPVDPTSYYGPSVYIECVPGRHHDGDCFPGTWREWDEVV